MIGVMLFYLLFVYLYLLIRIEKWGYEEPESNLGKHFSNLSLPNKTSVLDHIVLT